ncbi:MAG: GGDEF domain-containing protein [Lachnospiraceae bacterium]|nr:GGDEF domain-containing protein [Lachnospiraceae bacterium]
MNNKLRSKTTHYIILIISATMGVIFLFVVFLQFRSTTRNAIAYAEEDFYQIDQILEENENELDKIQGDFETSCLAHAKTAAYIIQCDPLIYEDRDLNELKKIAALLEVDEIHIFSTEGVIVFGTQPEYYGMSFDSGEQIGFFKPLLYDRSLELVQGIEANTAEAKPVQYSALWSEDGRFIVQIGMYPARVLEFRAKNEISYIFSLLRSNQGVDFYAVDPETKLIVGCSDNTDHAHLNDGTLFSFVNDQGQEKPIYTTIDEKKCFVVYKKIQGMYVCYVTRFDTLYGGAAYNSVLFLLGLLLLTVIAISCVSYYIEVYVLNNIHTMNKGLRKITEGDFIEISGIRNSQEFAELTDHINDMVLSLVENRKRIEKERDIDLLTGLYNRRGMELEIEKLMKVHEAIGHCAIVVADADCLKTINDTYGHENGDAYLCRLAETLDNAGLRKSLTARHGGDEFVLFLYGYETKDLLERDIAALRAKQSGKKTSLLNDVVVDLEFSLGVAEAEERFDYKELFKKADDDMYIDKRKRKSGGCAAKHTPDID